MVKLELYEIKKPEDKRLKYILPNLPKPPFRWIQVGRTGSGKSTLLRNIMFNPKFYKKYFDEMFYFCGSIDDLTEVRALKKKHRMGKILSVIGPELDLSAVEDLYEDIEETNAKEKTPSRVLFIFDDHITSNSFSSRKLNIVDKCFVQGRHINLSVMISTQKYKALNPNLRTINVTALSVFRSNKTELDQIATDHSNHLTKEELYDKLQEALKKRYNSITVNYSNDSDNLFLDSEFMPLM